MWSERSLKHVKITPPEQKSETYKLAASERRDEETLRMRDRVQNCDVVSVISIVSF